MDSLSQKFSTDYLTGKKGTVHNFLKDECNLSFKKKKKKKKKIIRLPAARNSPDKIQARKVWVIKWG
ncbi:hypothetical protein BD770DRAFT_461361 [Pilaira anomala]|nr:hypothetical protein BD770DRAFT_461361 [Pilaira anomala]